MQFFTAVVLGAAGLAAAVPTSSGQSKPLEKRIADSSNCGLDMYWSPTQGPIHDAISYLHGDSDNEPPNPFYVNAGECGLISCSYGTGIKVCADKDLSPARYPFDPALIGDYVKDTYTDCYDSSPSSGSGNTIRAYQRWAEGFNVLVEGGHDC
ncbi:MAG: hypothetical protein M1831_004554 [Alyxoria varia]|nr:MAG: hypothetical protein M1831_004554 [Alyxoria varia]